MRSKVALVALVLAASQARGNAPNAQYTINNPTTATATVTDNRTRLEWVRGIGCSNGTPGAPTTPNCTWAGALDYCKSLNSNTFAGSTDWRLPSVKELQTIVDRRPAYVYTTADPTAFPNMPPGVTDVSNQQVIAFWTSTPLAGDTTHAWYVDFAYGFVQTQSINGGTSTFRAYARCVHTPAF